MSSGGENKQLKICGRWYFRRKPKHNTSQNAEEFVQDTQSCYRKNMKCHGIQNKNSKSNVQVSCESLNSDLQSQHKNYQNTIKPKKPNKSQSHVKSINTFDIDAPNILQNIVYSTVPKPYKYVAIDCEMVLDNRRRKMLARVSLVSEHCECVYDVYVKPQGFVVDYRTEVSGIRKEDLQYGENFYKVRRDVEVLIRSKILVGHDLSQDLLVLHLEHPVMDQRDTSRYTPLKKYAFGNNKPSLKNLAKYILGIDIQESEHDSVIDALVSMQIYLKFAEDWEKYFIQSQYLFNEKVWLDKNKYHNAERDFYELCSKASQPADFFKSNRNATSDSKACQKTSIEFKNNTGDGTDTISLSEITVDVNSDNHSIQSRVTSANTNRQIALQVAKPKRSNKKKSSNALSNNILTINNKISKSDTSVPKTHFNNLNTTGSNHINSVSSTDSHRYLIKMNYDNIISLYDSGDRSTCNTDTEEKLEDNMKNDCRINNKIIPDPKKDLTDIEKGDFKIETEHSGSKGRNIDNEINETITRERQLDPLEKSEQLNGDKICSFNINFDSSGQAVSKTQQDLIKRILTKELVTLEEKLTTEMDNALVNVKKSLQCVDDISALYDLKLKTLDWSLYSDVEQAAQQLHGLVQQLNEKVKILEGKL